MLDVSTPRGSSAGGASISRRGEPRPPAGPLAEDELNPDPHPFP